MGLPTEIEVQLIKKKKPTVVIDYWLSSHGVCMKLLLSPSPAVLQINSQVTAN